MRPEENKKQQQYDTIRNESRAAHEVMPSSCVSWLNLIAETVVWRFMRTFSGLGDGLCAASVCSV